MPALILPRRFTQQPQGPVEIKPEFQQNLLGAIHYFGGAWVDGITGHVFSGTNVAPRPTPWGLAGDFNGTSSQVALGDPAYLQTASFAVEMLIIADSESIGDTTRKQLFSKDNASGREINIQLGDDIPSGTVAGGLSVAYFSDNSTNTLQNQRSGSGVLAGALSHLVFNITPSAKTVTAALNGNFVSLANDSNFASSIQNTASTLYIGARDYSGYQEWFNGAIFYARVYKRALSNNEVEELSRNPWQIFKPRRKVLYFSIGSVPIPTLSSPGVTNILTTSVTPQVTLTF